MSSLAILFLAIIFVVIPKNEASSSSIKDIDIAKLLDLVQQQRNNRGESSESDDSETSGDVTEEVNQRISQLRNEDSNILSDLMNKILKEKKTQPSREEQRAEKRLTKHVNTQGKLGASQRNTADNLARLLGQLVNKGLQVDNTSPRNRLKPHRLLGNVKNRNTNDDGLEEYSKIYVLLNPKAVQKSKNGESAINKLVSKLLSLSALPVKKDRQVKAKQNRYKGFAIRENIGRRRGSRESMYAPDSMEMDRPKRQRGGGGGGPGGHTAIPYIRHGGDNIYEKENY